MKQFGKLLLVALGFGILAVVLSSFPNHPAAAAPGGPTVTVVNTASNPVPVAPQGTTPVSGTVHAAQSGNWNVGITGNTSANPLFERDTDNPAKQPFVSQCSADITGGTSACNFATVPAGKELVIEMFTVSIRMNIGDRPLFTVLGGAANGTAYQLNYPLSFNGTFTVAKEDFWVGQQPLTRAYADPGTTPGCAVGVNSGQGISGLCQISGYLVNVP